MKVSVICTNYNKGNWIEDALKGILAQECTFDFELVVIDDASTDNSPEIIRQYAERYPHQIKTIFNETNEGCTRACIHACSNTSGDYIARCDGDDYWTDTHKLQKQVDALEASTGSKWCSTDFDIVDSDGNLIEKSAQKSGTIARMTCFEEQLALQGMTMSSTWLVERNLMLEVNSCIDPDAIDESFCLQLEMFMRTNLTNLEDSTTAYRLMSGTDSHPDDVQKMCNRIKKLEQKQIEYLDKNNAADLDKLSRLFIRESAKRDITITETIDALRRAHESLDEAKEEIAKLIAENKRIYNELSGMCTDLSQQLTEAIEERDMWRDRHQEIVTSKRWRLASKGIDLIKKPSDMIKRRK